MNIFTAFTSDNMLLLVNGNALSAVKEIYIKDVRVNNKLYTNITLKRYIFDKEEVIDEMRTGPFTFVLKNGDENRGYVASGCELEDFEMYLVNDSANNVVILEQKLIIKANTFMYVQDARPETLKQAEESDTQNLIDILKNAQKNTQDLPVMSAKETTKEKKIQKAKTKQQPFADPRMEKLRSQSVVMEDVIENEEGDI